MTNCFLPRCVLALHYSVSKLILCDRFSWSLGIGKT